MLIGSPSKVDGNSSTQTRMQSSSRIFSARIQRVCQFLKQLAANAYQNIYKKEKAEFYLIPLPRLEIQKIEDLKILFDCGILESHHSVELSSILLGEFKRKRPRDEGRK